MCVMQMGASIKQGKEQARYYEHLAKVNEMEAQRTEETGFLQEKLIQTQASRDASAVRTEGKRVDAAQRVAQSASGVGAGSATSEDLARDTLSQQQLDEMAVRYSADMKSWETRNQTKFQAWDLRNQAKENRQAGRNAKSAGVTGAFTSLFDGATQFAGNYAAGNYGSRKPRTGKS